VDAKLAERALAALQGTSFERVALAAVARAHAQQPVAESIALLAAELHVKRGEADRALGFLKTPRGIPALLLAADLHAERGETALAVTLVERALARDIDAPGARERHARLRRGLGNVAQAGAGPGAGDATLLTASAPETSFRVVGEAGRGGAGTVYEAVDDALSRRIALKVYHQPEHDRDKLVREARTAVAFRGSGVIRVFDVDTERGLIVMEWLPAGALKQWLVRADAEFLWPIERWMVPLTRALSRVHDAGYVHADIKPANVLFRSAAAPVLSDFGLAHRAGESVAGGSRGYLSPERLAGEPVRPSDDVYALGRLMEDALVALGRGGGDRTGPSRELELLCARCLGGAAERPPDARQLLQALSDQGAR
jgi:serine/threonine-protein kinase